MSLFDQLRSMRNAELLSISTGETSNLLGIGSVGPDLMLVGSLAEKCRELIRTSTNSELTVAYHESMVDPDRWDLIPLRTEMMRRQLLIRED